MTCRTLFIALGKRTCKLIQRAQKTHMSIKVDYKCHSLFGKHRKRTCQVRLGTHRKCTCQVRLTSSLALYSDSAQTEDVWIFFPILRLSLGRMNSSFTLDRHGDKTLFFISLLLEGGKGRGVPITHHAEFFYRITHHG